MVQVTGLAYKNTQVCPAVGDRGAPKKNSIENIRKRLTRPLCFFQYLCIFESQTISQHAKDLPTLHLAVGRSNHPSPTPPGRHLRRPHGAATTSPTPIWGWSYSTQDITIKVSWDTTTVKVKTDNTAFWGTTLFTPVAGGPHTITVKAGNETITLKDVMTGEVWLCAGQSNMEWMHERFPRWKGRHRQS